MFLLKNTQFILVRTKYSNQLSHSLLQQKCSRLSNFRMVNAQISCFNNNYWIKTVNSLSYMKTLFPNSTCFSTIKTSNHETINNNVHDEEAEQNRKNQRSWKIMKYGIILICASISIAGIIFIYKFGRPNYDVDGQIIQDEFSDLPNMQQIYYRSKKNVLYFKKLVQGPSRDKLLPDPLKYPYIQPPYTIILELTDVLVHPDWTYQTGWRFKKRPGIDHFLETIAAPQFETVVYTAGQGATVFPILDALDPQGYIMYRLVRDATKFVDGHHVKDLDALNRDLRKVIVIDWNSESVKFHPENMMKIPRWNGGDNDTTLYDLAAFLKTIYETNVDDIRDVISYYRQFDNPLETFRENQRKLLMQLEEEKNNAQKEEKKRLISKWRPSFLRSC